MFVPNCSDFAGSQNDVVHSDLLMGMSTKASEVKNILPKLDVSEAIGADNIPARILPEFSLELSYPLSNLFNIYFRLGVVPQVWKRANNNPVFKSDHKNLVQNYRSISFVSNPSNCQEEIVHQAIFPHVAPCLNNLQHGFMTARSCVTQLVLFHHQWTKAFDAGNQVNEVFLDFS